MDEGWLHRDGYNVSQHSQSSVATSEGAPSTINESGSTTSNADNDTSGSTTSNADNDTASEMSGGSSKLSLGSSSIPSLIPSSAGVLPVATQQTDAIADGEIQLHLPDFAELESPSKNWGNSPNLMRYNSELSDVSNVSNVSNVSVSSVELSFVIFIAIFDISIL